MFQIIYNTGNEMVPTDAVELIQPFENVSN